MKKLSDLFVCSVCMECVMYGMCGVWTMCCMDCDVWTV